MGLPSALQFFGIPANYGQDQTAPGTASTAQPSTSKPVAGVNYPGMNLGFTSPLGQVNYGGVPDQLASHVQALHQLFSNLTNPQDPRSDMQGWSMTHPQDGQNQFGITPFDFSKFDNPGIGQARQAEHDALQRQAQLQSQAASIGQPQYHPRPLGTLDLIATALSGLAGPYGASQLMNAYTQGRQTGSEKQYENQVIQAQNQQRALQAQAQGAGAEAQYQGQTAGALAQARQQAIQDELESEKAQYGYGGKGLMANARLGSAQITTDGRILTTGMNNDANKPVRDSQVVKNLAQGNMYDAQGNLLTTKANDINATQDDRKAVLEARAKDYMGKYGLTQAQAANLAQKTALLPAESQAKIAELYGRVSNYQSLASNRQNLSDIAKGRLNLDQLKAVDASTESGLRNLSAQANELQRAKASVIANAQKTGQPIDPKVIQNYDDQIKAIQNTYGENATAIQSTRSQIAQSVQQHLNTSGPQFQPLYQMLKPKSYAELLSASKVIQSLQSDPNYKPQLLQNPQFLKYVRQQYQKNIGG